MKKLWWIGAVVVLVAALALQRLTMTPSESPRTVDATDAAPKQLAHAASPTPQLRSQAAVNSLRRDLEDPNPVVRARAVYSGDADDPALLAAIRDSDQSVSAVASDAIVKRYRDRAFSTKEVIGLYQDTSLGLRSRIALLNGLAERDEPEVRELLLHTLTDGTVEQRRAAANMLARQDPGSAVPALVAALSDKDNYVRSHARDSLREVSRGRDFGDDASAWSRWWSEQSSER